MRLDQSFQTLSQALLLVLLSPKLVLALQNDFTSYPSGSQACLSDAADQAACTGSTGTELNKCLCKNQGNFIYNSATCVAKASPADLGAVYSTMQNNCAGTGVTIAVSEDAFLAAAAAATSTATTTTMATTTPTGTTTSTGASSTTAATPSGTSTDAGTTTATSTDTSTSTSTAAPSSSGDQLSTGSKIGIGAGIGLGGVALILAGVFLYLYNKRRQDAKKLQAYSPASAGENHSSAFGGGRTEDSNHTTMMTTAGTSPFPGSTEMSPWKSSGAGGFYHGRENAAAGQPLLAELGGEERGSQPVEIYSEQRPEPVELPATPPAAREDHEEEEEQQWHSRHAAEQSYGGGGAETSDGVSTMGSGTIGLGVLGPEHRYVSPAVSQGPYSPPQERSHF